MTMKNNTEKHLRNSKTQNKVYVAVIVTLFVFSTSHVFIPNSFAEDNFTYKIISSATTLGLFSWVGDAADWVGDRVSDGWDGIKWIAGELGIEKGIICVDVQTGEPNVNGGCSDLSVNPYENQLASLNDVHISSTSKIDWNKDEPKNSDGGDPLVFSVTNKPVNIIRNWSEQDKSFLTEFDLFDTGRNVILSRTLDDGTLTLFLDLNGDSKLSDGTEWLYDQHDNVYQILSKPLIDSNQNGWFDYSDNLWSIAMIKDGDRYFMTSNLGILGFNWSDAQHYENDKYGTGRYSDCLYDDVFLYPECKPVSENHFRIAAYNDHGILLQGGKIIPTFGGIMGWLNTSE